MRRPRKPVPDPYLLELARKYAAAYIALMQAPRGDHAAWQVADRQFDHATMMLASATAMQTLPRDEWDAMRASNQPQERAS